MRRIQVRTMNKAWILTTAVAALLCGSVEANAENRASTDIQVSAHARRICHISGAGTSWHIRGSDLLDDATALVKSGITQQADITGVLCNYNAQFGLMSLKGALVADPAIPAAEGFQNLLRYRAIATWVEGSVAAPELVANGSAAELKTSTYFGRPVANGTIHVSFAIPQGDNALPVFAGNYKDTLRVIVAPNF
jgi:hypothetical protein